MRIPTAVLRRQVHSLSSGQQGHPVRQALLVLQEALVVRDQQVQLVPQARPAQPLVQLQPTRCPAAAAMGREAFPTLEALAAEWVATT